jgi:hypothetical protein
VRAKARGLLRSRRHERPPRLDSTGEIADEIARYARACTPPDLDALATLRKLTLADVLAELASHDPERRRQAARQLAGHAWALAKTVPQGLLDEAAGRLLSDTDPLLRLHGVNMVRGLPLARLFRRLRELENTETDPWVQHYLTQRMP